MKEMISNNNELYFLAGGGEMGQLIRDTDWSKTALGDPTGWPRSLKTMVAVMLNNPFGMYIAWGKDYTQIYNDGYRPILGSTKHPRALGISTRDTFSEVWHIIGSMFDGVMDGTPIGFPDFMLPLDRNGFVENCYFDFAYSPIKIDNGEVGGVLVTVIETTSKKKAIDSLKENEQRFRAMADNIPHMAWMANAEGTIFWYNKKWYEYTGISPEEMPKTGPLSLYEPSVLPLSISEWELSLKTGKPFEMIIPIKGSDGTFKQFLTRRVPVYDEDGKISLWFGTNTDITKQIETEQSLKESEQRFRTMAEGTDVMIAVGDETSNATYFNKAWTDLTGRPMEDLLKFGWADLIHPDDRKKYVNIYLSAFEKKLPFTGQFQILNNGGQYAWLLAKGQPIFRPDGSFAGYISSCIDITEQVHALKILEESGDDLRSMVLQSPIGVCVLDAQTRICEIVNDAFLEIAGRQQDEIIGKHYWDVFAETRSEYEPAMSMVASQGESFYADEVKLSLIRYGIKEEVFVTFVYAPLKEANGQVKKIAVWMMENSQQILARQRLEEAEQKSRLAINSANLGVYEIDYASDKMITDHRFKEIWGFEKDASRTEYANAIHPEDVAYRNEAHARANVSGQLDYQARVIWNDKSIHWTRVTGSVIYDENKVPEKIIGIIQDITESVTARKKIEESERDIRNMITQAPVAMAILTGKTYVLEIANTTMYELWGRPESELLGKPLFDALPEAKGQGFEQLLDHTFTTGERYIGTEAEIQLPRNGGLETVYVSFVYEAMRRGDGSISGILVVGFDATETVIARRQIEKVVAERTKELKELNEILIKSEDKLKLNSAELEVKNIELEKMNKELQSFAYISSHDLQEPLRKIQTFTSQILDNEFNHLSDSGKYKFQRMQNAAERMQRLIEDLLAYSRTSVAEGKFEIIDLGQLVDEVKEDLKEELARTEATIEMSNMCRISVIPFQFRQLIQNLISNSLKFAKPDERPYVKISSEIRLGKQLDNVKLEADLEYCHIQISDQGIGFEEEYNEKIFHVFQRLHAQDQYKGTGIGLAIVKRIVDNHNGLITAKGEPAIGATFDIYIPKNPKS